MFYKNGVPKDFAKFVGKHLCLSLFINKVAGLKPATLFKKETLARVFSCEFSEIFKNTFLTEHLRAPPSASLIWMFLRRFQDVTGSVYVCSTIIGCKWKINQGFFVP